MAKRFESFAGKHPILASVCLYIAAAAPVAGIFASGYGVASLVVWSQANQVIAAQREDYQKSLALLSGRVASGATATKDAADKAADAAETARSAAETAQAAAVTAKTAAQKADHAGGAAKEASANASRAASTAQSAAGTLTRALHPPPAPPAEVPDWLNTP